MALLMFKNLSFITLYFERTHKHRCIFILKLTSLLLIVFFETNSSPFCIIAHNWYHLFIINILLEYILFKLRWQKHSSCFSFYHRINLSYSSELIAWTVKVALRILVVPFVVIRMLTEPNLTFSLMVKPN